MTGTGCKVILLAGGKGTRMKTDLPKTYLELGGKELIRYSLDAVEACDRVEGCILVCAPDRMAYVREQILDRHGYTKVLGIAAAGRERYESVINGIRLLDELEEGCEQGGSGPAGEGILLICDGARPFLTPDLLRRCMDGAAQYGACVAAVPSKDTVKLLDPEGFVSSTPPRSSVWIIQTPQAFKRGLITEGYRKLEQMIREADAGRGQIPEITDDASVAELLMGARVRLVMGDYRNIKITTPEDLPIAEEIRKGL